MVKLVVGTEDEGMVATEPCQVVLNGPDILVQVVSLRVTLCTDVHRTATHTCDGNHREVGLDITAIAYSYEADTGLIAHVWRDTALKLSDERVGIALERIAVGIGVQAGSTAAATQLLCLDQTPADGKFVELVDVPVEFQARLIALGVDILVAEVIVESHTLLLSHLLQHIHDVLRLLGIHLRVTGIHAIEVRIFLVGTLVVGEEEEFVLDDRSTQGNTHVILSLLLILRRITRSIQIRILGTDEVLVVAIVIGRTVELVGTALGDGIDGTTGETALSHIERSYRHLNLLDGLHRYRLSTRLTAVITAGSQTEHVVVGRTINHEVVVSVVGTGKRHVTRISNRELRVQASHIGNTVGDTRHIVDLLGIHTGGSTCTRSSETRLASYHHFLELMRILLQGEGEVGSFTQAQVYIIDTLVLVSDIRYFNLVWSTRTHTLDGVTAIDIRHGTIHRT